MLHGLLGSSRNWTTAGKLLARSFEVFALDLRGHGDSPWAPARDYSVGAMAGDVAAWREERRLERAFLLGHSLGGKVAMRLAVDAPKLWRGLVVADLAPKDYPPHHLAAFDAMRALDVAALTTRAQAEEFLRARLTDGALVRFLLTNLAREADEAFRWRIDLEGLAAALPELGRSPLEPGERYPGPALFLRGEQSDYILDTDRPQIAAHFPRHQILMIGQAGHNLHVDQPAAFTAALEYFAREV
ncbi:MAG: alpha/beta fold hydrolase [Opitutales bacterium]